MQFAITSPNAGAVSLSATTFTPASAPNTRDFSRVITFFDAEAPPATPQNPIVLRTMIDASWFPRGGAVGFVVVGSA